MKKKNAIVAELKRLAFQGEIEVRHAHNIDLPVSGLRALAIRDDLRAIEAEYCDAIETSIDEWKIGGDLPELPPHSREWRRARIFAALYFLEMMQVLPQVTPMDDLVFPEPLISEEEAIKWLLTDWWREHGLLWHAMLTPISNE